MCSKAGIWSETEKSHRISTFIKMFNSRLVIVVCRQHLLRDIVVGGQQVIFLSYPSTIAIKYSRTYCLFNPYKSNLFNFPFSNLVDFHLNNC